MSTVPKVFQRVLLRLAKMRQAEVCRHYVGEIILSEMETDDPSLGADPDFRALVEAFSLNSEGDEQAVSILGSCVGSTSTSHP